MLLIINLILVLVIVSTWVLAEVVRLAMFFYSIKDFVLATINAPSYAAPAVLFTILVYYWLCSCNSIGFFQNIYDFIRWFCLTGRQQIEQIRGWIYRQHPQRCRGYSKNIQPRIWFVYPVDKNHIYFNKPQYFANHIILIQGLTLIHVYLYLMTGVLTNHIPV